MPEGLCLKKVTSPEGTEYILEPKPGSEINFNACYVSVLLKKSDKKATEVTQLDRDIFKKIQRLWAPTVLLDFSTKSIICPTVAYENPRQSKIRNLIACFVDGSFHFLVHLL